MKYDAVAGPASGSTKKEAPKNLVIERIEIQPSENGGYVTRCHKKESKADRSRSTYPGYIEPEVYTFESFDSMMKHLKSTLS